VKLKNILTFVEALKQKITFQAAVKSIEMLEVPALSCFIVL
jgi:hypothetical protein